MTYSSRMRTQLVFYEILRPFWENVQYSVKALWRSMFNVLCEGG